LLPITTYFSLENKGGENLYYQEKSLAKILEMKKLMEQIKSQEIGE
jgi:hypothetical protein